MASVNNLENKNIYVCMVIINLDKYANTRAKAWTLKEAIPGLIFV
jgi:hypothetical protein